MNTAVNYHEYHNATVPVGNYLFRVNKKPTRTRCEMCWKLTIKTPVRCQWRRSGAFIVDFEHNLHLALMSLLLTLSRYEIHWNKSTLNMLISQLFQYYNMFTSKLLRSVNFCLLCYIYRVCDAIFSNLIDRTRNNISHLKMEKGNQNDKRISVI